MFSDQYFYYGITRKMVVLFGSLFNNISLVRKAKDTGKEIERVKVPIVYAPKEKYVTQLFSNPDLQRSVQTILPRMSFEIKDITYDPARKQNSLLKVSKPNTSTAASSQFMGVPYNFSFSLNIYSRHIDDGTHIVEQILPYFNPDYTVAIDTDIGVLKDIPVILESVSNDIEYEGGSDSIRMVYWTLNFTVKGYYYGPISQPKIIRKVITNIYQDKSLVEGNIIRINVANGNSGSFASGDIVFQGDSYTEAKAFAYVVDWSPNRQYLTIGQPQGTFKTGQLIKSASSNASYNVVSFDASPLKLAKIVIVPDPIDADPEDAYGYDTTITEWPSANVYSNT